MTIPLKDILIDHYSSGSYQQRYHVYRMTHIPTGLVVTAEGTGLTLLAVRAAALAELTEKVQAAGSEDSSSATSPPSSPPLPQ